MGVIQTVKVNATFTASLMRSPSRGRCAKCGKRRVGYTLAYGVLGDMATIPDYQCGECFGIREVTHEVSAPPEHPTDAVAIDWDGFFASGGESQNEWENTGMGEP